MKCSLGIKDPWYIKSLDMVPSAENPEILEMKVGVDFLEGSKASKTSTIYIKKIKISLNYFILLNHILVPLIVKYSEASGIVVGRPHEK
ncbi:MAG: hypothetical protein SPF69_02085 [Candidatus Ornithospirochaeta sp.]|nr:hypothetical protein [Sphaerochaetaceae bacterium]MDY5522860.1 hypothetical protein [Candidatus Ornithospirochaeta sp.]